MRLRYITILSVFVVIYFTIITDFTVIKKEGKHYGTSVDELQANYRNKKIQRRLNGYAKPDKPDKYVEYFNNIKKREGSINYSANYKQEALKSALKRNQLLKSTTEKLDWKQLGPANVGGRTRAIIIDPEDPSGSTWFAGAVAGGVWKTINKGETWDIISPNLPNLAISSMAMAKSNPSVIYAGTGEGYFNIDAVRGDGIFKTTDKGETWQQLEYTANNEEFNYINSIVVSNDDENLVICATNSGIYKSDDGGINWLKVSLIDGRYQKLIQHPIDINVYWAACHNNGVYKSDDGGDSWYQTETFGGGANRIELAISNNNPDVLFALTEDSKVYFSEDGGLEWGEAIDEDETDFLSGQGWYNNVIAAHPNNTMSGYIGGVDLFSFTIGEEIKTSNRAYTVNTTSSDYFEPHNSRGSFQNGAVLVYDEYNNVSDEIEIQFGTGKSQKAHVFVNKNLSNDYSQDIKDDLQLLKYDSKYVTVPFEVINKRTNTKLNASFIDSNKNGKFDLYDGAYEVIIVHNSTYSNSYNSQIVSKNGNEKILGTASLTSSSWDETNVPNYTISINPYELSNRTLKSERITRWSLPVDDENYSHADHHSINVIDKSGGDFEILVGNDGGLSLSEDGGYNWKTRINGYISSQFYGIDRHPSKYLYFGGMQDNGSYISPENPDKDSEWSATLSGDGFDVAWHSRKPDHFIGSYYYNILEKSRDGGEHFQSLENVVPDVGDGNKAPFVTCLANSDVDPDLLFLGGVSGISRSDDFGSSWSIAEMGSNWGYSIGYAPKIEISQANPEIVWAGVKLSSDSRLQLSVDGGRSFKEIANPVNNYIISNIVTHPLYPQTAYVLFSHANFPKILRTTDLGETWEDITGFGTSGSSTSSNGFPNVATLSMLVAPEKPNELWAGTEIGLFISKDNGTSWEYSDNGLPAVSIWDMNCKGDEIVLATHGLGVWTLKREGVTNTLKHPYIVDASSSPKQELIISSIADVEYDSLQIYINDEIVNIEYNTPLGSRNNIISIESLNDIKLKLVGYIGEVAYISNTKYLSLLDIKDPVNSYVNNFSYKFEDFYGDGFKVSRGILDNNAIQSNHPYEKDVDLTYQLKYPIIVSDDEDTAFIEYEDIAFVEEGEVGATFLDQSFYDYAIVEATLNGIDWIPIIEGYDYSYNAEWKSSGRNVDSSPKQSDYTKHHINLLDFFNPQDTILIRFRLFSDEEVTGWGWAIDNLKIQDSTFLRVDDIEFEVSIKPNPIKNGLLHIDIEDAYQGNLDLKIYDLSGKIIYSELVNKNLGSFKLTRNINFPTGGVFIVNLMMNERNVTKKVLVIH
ncbi:T9SS type A sorting domain-containing protein [Saccharicrinis aurantiacus]|uniref:T9SS type A sorting domain-containing protein n=1 Tax=Saccharicrinis aurantiacus TaxID=1849719 RepID=UPI00094FA24B|nr:T9SS type A sorting domain-containing protein [Saccharicrinis aurantiacus]